jgi:hypothetical protein
MAPPFGIKCPPDGGIPVPSSVQEGTLPPTKLDETKSAVLYDLILNRDRTPSRHRYSKHTVSFALAAHVFSGAYYRFLREILDLPCEQTLRESTSESVTLIQSIRSDIDGVERGITEYLEDYASLVTSQVRCTL